MYDTYDRHGIGLYFIIMSIFLDGFNSSQNPAKKKQQKIDGSFHHIIIYTYIE